MKLIIKIRDGKWCVQFPNGYHYKMVDVQSAPLWRAWLDGMYILGQTLGLPVLSHEEYARRSKCAI